MILNEMRSCTWKLVVGFRSYGLIRFSGPSNPNKISRPQIPKWQNFLRFHDFIQSNLWFWTKWSPVLKLMVGFRSYGFIRLFLCPSSPNVVSRLQTPKEQHFLRFHDFIESSLWLWMKWGPVRENWW